METPIKILLMIVSWKGNESLWPNILNRGVDDIVILCGGSDKESYVENKILNLKCSDSYEGLPEKIICGIDFILKNEEFSSFTHIIKIDDHDSYFNKRIIDDIIKYSDLLKIHPFIGQRIAYYPTTDYHFNRVTKESYWYNRHYKGECSPFVPGYATYILNREAMRCINKTFNSSNIQFVRRNYILEDVMIGLVLSAYNIIPFELCYGIKYNIKYGINGFWDKIGNENQVFHLPIGTLIRFGVDDSWIEKITDTDSFIANLEYFEKDPCSGRFKGVYIFINDNA